MSAMDKLTMDMLKKKYPCIPEERLNDLKEIAASDEQFERVNANYKKNTDEELSGYLLEKRSDVEGSSRPSMVVAVIGASGSGKSATGNTLLQAKKFKESSSATSETVREQSYISTREPTLTVIDTPGTWKLPKEHTAHLYVLVVNLSSPRFSKDDLKDIKALKDKKNQIVKNDRCVLILTHARDALHGKSLAEYVHEIRGDPLHDLIVKDMGKKNVMAVNNNCKSSYEEEHQRKMIDTLLMGAYAEASFAPESCWSKYFKSWVAICILLLAVIIGLSIWCGVESANHETVTVYTLVYPNGTDATETISATISTNVYPTTNTTEVPGNVTGG